MAVNISVASLAAALRLGDTAEEIEQVTRLLAYTTESVSKHLAAAYVTAPETIVNEAVIRLSGYLFDKPYTSQGFGFADALSLVVQVQLCCLTSCIAQARWHMDRLTMRGSSQHQLACLNRLALRLST